MKHYVLFILIILSSSSVYAEGFIQQLINRQLKDATQEISVDISKLEPGSAIRVKYVDRPVLIYRRTNQEIANLRALRPKLSDPDDSQLLNAIKSNYQSSSSYVWTRLLLSVNRGGFDSTARSINPEYFVFGGWGPYSGCSTSINTDTKRKQQGIAFHDPCVGASYDAAGRSFAAEMHGNAQGEQAIFNLYIPPHRFEGPNIIIIGLSNENTIKELPSSYTPSYSNLTPLEQLIKAAKFNDIHKVKSALRDGAPANYWETGKGSPLDAAIIGSDIEVVELLIKNGAQETPNTQRVAKFIMREQVLMLLGKSTND